MSLKGLGLRAIDRGDYQEAVNIFKRALEKKRDAEGLLGLATAYHRLGDPQTARWAFYKVLELDAHNDRALTGLKELESKALKRKPKKIPGSLFRAREDHFELNSRGKWTKVFIKGINIGLGLPGYFPGEYSIGKHTYEKWFQQIAGLGVNAIRIYTIHPPSFYQAFREFNESEKRMHLFQGIWAELPEKNDFDDHHYRASIRESIRNAVDVVYGNANLPEKPGHASGVFDHDVSRYTAGFIFGREWESCAVKNFNESRGRDRSDYRGNFLQIANGTPFEMWLTRACDLLQSYEYRSYHASHPVSAVNWPTLDPAEHPSESPYDEELRFQGMRVSTDACSENEDMESVDFSKITAHQGGGFFATYHVYPYYPDFMNNDYPNEADPYLAYLRALKRSHGRQPVFIAEFGVPSSRDASHWQKNGWHHGGHTEKRQGEINGLLMRSIHEAGMAGGALFSWFDEWFKRSWVFSPYELPADRTPLWFSIQDAEKNYGLLAAYPGYPGKLVTLSGQRQEWSTAEVLYEKKGAVQSHKFHDGFDGSRSLARLLVQHDEGFLYVMLEAKENVDFSRAHYLIGLDTCCSDAGEFLLPFKTNLLCPIGLKFLVHLAGESKSRILVCGSYDKYLNAGNGEIRPMTSDQGAWVMMQNKTNSRRISKDKKTFYPSRVFSMSGLRYGSLDPKDPRFNSLSDFSVHKNMIELRIPWSLINVTDPSSRSVLWMDGNGKTKKTEGIKIIAASYKPDKGFLYAENTGKKHNAADSLPGSMTREAVRQYTWEEYSTPVYHTYLKSSYEVYKKILSGLPETL
jgi:hypothetical protein